MKLSRLRCLVPGLMVMALSPHVGAQEVRADSASHVVKRGDTLWDLAKSYLGDAYLWPEIYRLNTDQIEDPHWIYPGATLRLPGQSTTVAATRRDGPTVFTPVPLVPRRSSAEVAAAAPRPRVSIGDVVRAPWVAEDGGPTGSGRIIFGADIPGIDRARSTSNFQLYDRVLIEAPAGTTPAVRDRYVAYTLGTSIEGFGTVAVPVALLQVAEVPSAGVAITAQVLELYGQVSAEARLVRLDTAGAGAVGVPVPMRGARTASVKYIHRPAVLPSIGHEIMVDLSARDGMRIGDELEVFRAAVPEIRDERPALPEVPIATAQVVRVTAAGTTARIISQQQPAIRVGETVRIRARMP